jgi:ribonuclease HII
MLALRCVKDSILEIGVDEAGRGPLWGPMMAAAVLWPCESTWTKDHRELRPSIKDSKKLSAKKREQVCEKIKELALGYGLGIVSAQEIDTLGATRANQLAFRRALESLYATGSVVSEHGVRILLDGILPLNDASSLEDCKTIVEGDATYLSIAAASILAKVEHDRWILDWCKTHVADAAKYDLLNCKGYGTAKHRSGILQHGYTDLHRRLYLRKLLPDIVVSRCGFIEDET